MSSDDLKQNSFVYGPNATYVAEIYERYLVDPDSVDASWSDYFSSLGDNVQDLFGDFGQKSWGTEKSQIVGYTPTRKERRKGPPGRRNSDKTGIVDEQSINDSIHAHQLIRAYRVRGHLLADLDPLATEKREMHPELDPKHYGFSEEDYDREIKLDGWLGMEKASLKQIIDILQESYSSKIGLEYMHIQSLEQKTWLEDKMEKERNKAMMSSEGRKKFLKHMVEVEGFEQFLHIKYPGTKRFSIEGGESLIPAMETVLDNSTAAGVDEIVVGMPHRGRLNVLTAFMGKPYAAMLSEFQGNLATPDHIEASGDVKYHLGTSSDRDLPNGKHVHLSLSPNPSHLEAVNPVVVGRVRAKQDQKNDVERTKVMGLLLHGDAAFSGQGVVGETLMLSDIKGYTTGGTVHIIVNNQIGFTTTPKDTRISPYPSDVAKTIQAPIFHVNGDDPEAVIHASQMAADYRSKFKKDVILDIFCYRRYGHNEGDEPMFTQPSMYKKIKNHLTPRDVYAETLISQGIVTKDEFEQMKKDFHEYMEGEFEAASNYKPNKADWLEGKWKGMEHPNKGSKAKVDTGFDIKKLKKLGNALGTVPESLNEHSKITRQLKAKKVMMETGENLDWAMGEALAFASLLTEGNNVRISGQDSRRGTFSHRHSAIRDQETEEIYEPLNNLPGQKGTFEAIDSNLSEYAVLGFEYGYSLAEPNTLTIWEAQFGDFFNGAQIVIDQFISSGESKWLRMSGLVMLLPHGYEGQGPEHSSARLERYLQLCAEDNMQVVNITTPANFFHCLRRQLKRNFRKPLIVMSPKSLLRHKRAQSSLKEFDKGNSFQRVIPETEKLNSNDKIKRAVLCSGKVYYDLLEAREAKKIKDIALIRVEQFYPFPGSEISKELKKYKNAKVIWCQEESKNMGAWQFIEPFIEEVLLNIKHKSKRPIYVGRKASASPAAGYMKLHEKEQKQLIKEALSK
jgi:2-oxoglutarate dehydrogenase E1 component